jgi:hypothetical protein
VVSEGQELRIDEDDDLPLPESAPAVSLPVVDEFAVDDDFLCRLLCFFGAVLGVPLAVLPLSAAAGAGAGAGAEVSAVCAQAAADSRPKAPAIMAVRNDPLTGSTFIVSLP